MFELEAGEELNIERGHMPTLKKVLERSLEAKKERLVDEQKAVDKIQGHAQVMRELLSLIN